jgi:hypothetical protein
MVQPKIVVRNTAPHQGDTTSRPRAETPSPQGGGKLTPLLTTGCCLARVRQAAQGAREARVEARREAEQGGKLTPLLTTGCCLARMGLGGMQCSMSPPNPLTTKTSRPQLVGAELASALGAGGLAALGPGVWPYSEN